MEDHTIISLVGIGAGVILLVVGMVIGNMSDAIVGISGAAIGAGVGIPLGVGYANSKEASP